MPAIFVKGGAWAAGVGRPGDGRFRRTGQGAATVAAAGAGKGGPRSRTTSCACARRSCPVRRAAGRADGRDGDRRPRPCGEPRGPARQDTGNRFDQDRCGRRIRVRSIRPPGGRPFVAAACLGRWRNASVRAERHGDRPGQGEGPVPGIASGSWQAGYGHRRPQHRAGRNATAAGRFPPTPASSVVRIAAGARSRAASARQGASAGPALPTCDE